MLKVIKGFKYAYDGHRVVEYREGDEIPDGDPCEEVALEERWVKQVKGKGKARKAEAPAAEDAEGTPDNEGAGASGEDGEE